MLFVVKSAVITYNAALNRPAYQSSVHSSKFARYANDGSRHTNYQTSPYCAHTNREANPWWAVDLEHPATIYRVDLTTSFFYSRKTIITGVTLTLDLYMLLVTVGGLVVQWLAFRTRDREVTGSTPGRCSVRQQLWANCKHPCASVTKQYNLVYRPKVGDALRSRR